MPVEELYSPKLDYRLAFTPTGRESSRARRRIRVLVVIAASAAVIGAVTSRALTAAGGRGPADIGVVDADLELVSLAGVDPLAVCGDGSPAAYYWRPGEATNSTWVVDLESGGWCWDAASCNWRCPPGTWSVRCSSKAFGPQLSRGGLLRRGGALEGSAVAYARYCSSDAWMGDAAAFGREFRGARILQALLTDLVRRGLGQGGRHTLLLSGQSAGARGAMVHLDYVHEMLAAAGLPDAAASVEVLGVLDSPLWVDISPYGASSEVLSSQCQSVYSFAQVKHLGGGCAQAHPQESWKCIMGEYRMPHVQTPYFLVASQFDSFQLNKSIGHAPSSDQERAYAETFASRTREVIDALAAGGAVNRSSIYSWACFDHAVTLEDRGFDGGTCAGNTIHRGLSEFLGAGSQRRLWIDSCDGFACGPGCPERPRVTMLA